ncbi:MAG: dynamin family protein [Planctomycetaceae bacterium]|jgi:energy-coupling factor transporter ATP-binding protein EcfA2|nr:dynamin family protein [Planctomycetaceae bacterium]
MSTSAESRTAKIQSIIENRKPIAQKTAKTIEQLKEVQSSLEAFAQFLPIVLEKDIPTENKAKIEELRNDLKTFDEQILLRLTELSQIQSRFERPTLNIGIVGNAGQGKSTFLQRLTGLAETEIPTGGQGDCTGVAAIIKNESVSNAYADIEFYSQEEFLNRVIAPFYKAMELPIPQSLEEFEKPLPDAILQKSSDENSDIKKVIERLHRELPRYRRYLGEKKKRIDMNEIRNYTAKSDQNGQPLVTWATVKSAEVHCSFPSLENEKISVGDTPGLGDRHVPDAEQKLMEDFGKNIDAVIMLRKINVRGIRTDNVRLFNLIREAIPELEPGAWSYFMVNVFSSEMLDPTTKEALEFLPKDFHDSPLKGVRSYIEVDCSDQNAVLNKFDEILTDIANNQNLLDETLYNKRFENVKTLIENINEFIEKAKKALPKTVAGVGTPGKLDRMFNDCWRKTAAGLVSIDEKYQEKCNTEDVEFVQKLEEIENELLQYDLSSKLNRSDMLGAGITQYFSDKYHELRLDLATAFDQLDEGLDKIIQNVRQEVCDVFMNTDQGGLENIFDVELKNDTKQWLLKLADQIREIDSGKKIAQTIQYFADITFSFRGHLLYRIRKNIDPLGRNNDFAVLPEDKFENAFEKTKLAWEKAVSDCCAALRGLAKEPNRALSAFVEDFCDGVLRIGGYDEAKSIWRIFYEQYRADIWSAEYAALEENTKLRDTWNRYLKELGDVVEQLKS